MGCWRTAGSMRTCGRASRAVSSPNRWLRRSRGEKPIPRVELANGWRRAKLKRARRIGGKQGCMSRRTTKILKAALSTLHYSGADSMIAPFTRGIGAIFMLHHVSPEKSSRLEPNRILKITPQFLELVIRQVRQSGFEIVSLDEAPFRPIEGDYGKPFVCFTFDEGYRDNLEHAYPIFKQHDLPFAVYVPTD